MANDGSLTHPLTGLWPVEQNSRASQYVCVFGAEISHGLDGIDGYGDTVPLSMGRVFMPLVWVEGDSRQCEISHRSLHSAIQGGAITCGGFQPEASSCKG